MGFAFNIVIIVLILFIAYWLANQGVFSALLHLLCVIVAGAIALAAWDPLTTRLLLRGTAFDHYAWGVSLVAVFAVSLLILRLIVDKVISSQLQFARGADMALGFIAGLPAGVLTVGMLLIGLSFVPSTNDVFGYRGWGRDERTGEIVQLSACWLPVHQITSGFYEWLSVTSFSTDRPLRQYNPALYKQASLVRDSYGDGQAQLSLKPSEADVRGVQIVSDGRRELCFIEVHFANGARDFGDQLTLSSAQVRLIGDAGALDQAPVVHPEAWIQATRYHKFDSVSHYVTSVPGEETTDVVFQFSLPSEFSPRLIQIRNTLYRLPAARSTGGQPFAGAFGASSREPAAAVTGGSIQSAVRVSNDIRPVNADTSQLPGSLKADDDRYLVRGHGTFQRGGSRPSRNLRLQGIAPSPGTRCVRVDVSRGKAADIFAVMNQVAEDARIVLVTQSGVEFTPIGFLYAQGEETEIKLDPGGRIHLSLIHI